VTTATTSAAAPTGRVLGVDGCRDGWVGVAPDPDGPRAYVAADLRELVRRAEQDGAVVRVGVDIPVGLADVGWRAADTLVRAALGSRRASLFTTPVRAALEADDHAAGVRLSRTASGAGFSIQAWGLRAKVLEVDRLVRDGEDRVREVHPELSFATMAGHPARHPKKTWAGQRERLALLEAAGIRLDALTGSTGTAGPDDVVDAAAAAWSARRLATGTAVSLPDPPEPLPHGLHAAVWA
jgi:predicted RNase H-like nuclease